MTIMERARKSGLRDVMRWMTGQLSQTFWDPDEWELYFFNRAYFSALHDLKMYPKRTVDHGEN